MDMTVSSKTCTGHGRIQEILSGCPDNVFVLVTNVFHRFTEPPPDKQGVQLHLSGGGSVALATPTLYPPMLTQIVCLSLPLATGKFTVV